MMQVRILITSFGYGIYSLENVPAGRKKTPPPIESVGFDPSTTKSIPDPESSERLFILASSGFPPSGMENVTAEDWERLRNAVQQSGDASFSDRLAMFETPN